MSKVSILSQSLFSIRLFLVISLGLLLPKLSYAEALSLQSVSLRSRISEKTVLGKDAPESFKVFDLSANIALPWKSDYTCGWGISTRLMASAGKLQGVGGSAFVMSLMPEIILGSEKGENSFDLGVVVAHLSKYRFGSHDYGGPFQFALTFGINISLYKNLSLGLRFLHYSDARVYGADTVGADFQMVELTYHFARKTPYF